jgi:hypothetical protein
VGPLRHARERAGMVSGLVVIQFARRECGRSTRFLFRLGPRGPRGRLVPLRVPLPVSVPRRPLPGHQELRHWVSGCAGLRSAMSRTGRRSYPEQADERGTNVWERRLAAGF